jgi:urocanate hydratase
VVGSQARILYSDQAGRLAIALAFNEAVAARRLAVISNPFPPEFWLRVRS